MSDSERPLSTEEVTRILKYAETSGAEVYCEMNAPGVPKLVHLEVRRALGTNIVLGLKRMPDEPGQMLSAVFTSGLVAGAPVEITISLVDGQYVIRDIVQDVSMTTFTVSAGRNFSRLQRRKDFRVSVRTDGLTVKTKNNIQGKPTDITLQVLDLSAGGLRLLWPPAAGEIPPLGTVLKSLLNLRAKVPGPDKPNAASLPEKTVTVEMKLVKDHGPDAPLKPDQGNAISFQFQNPGQDESRSILFTCLFIHRNSYT